MNTVEDFKQGDKVIYTPPSGNEMPGVVTGLNYKYVFVRYSAARLNEPTEPEDLKHAPKEEEPEKKPEKKYLGDGLYYYFDGAGIWLKAENGIDVLQQVYLEPAVLIQLLRALGGDFSVSHMVGQLERGDK